MRSSEGYINPVCPPCFSLNHSRLCHWIFIFHPLTSYGFTARPIFHQLQSKWMNRMWRKFDVCPHPADVVDCSKNTLGYAFSCPPLGHSLDTFSPVSVEPATYLPLKVSRKCFTPITNIKGEKDSGQRLTSQPKLAQDHLRECPPWL